MSQPPWPPRPPDAASSPFPSPPVWDAGSGTWAAPPTGSAPPVWTAPPAPAARRPRGRTLLLLLALVGVLAVGAGTAVAVQAYRTGGSPDAVVRAYFADLARGDAGDALAAGARPGGGTALVTDDVLRATVAAAPIEAVRVGTPSLQGATATVPVHYRIGGSTPAAVDDVVPMTRTAKGWRLTRSAVLLSLSVAQATTWAAVLANNPFAVPDSPQLVFPGVVPVGYRTAVLQVAPDTRLIRFAGATDRLVVDGEISATGAARAGDAVTSALAACAKGGAGVDPFCPQPAPGSASGVTFRSVPQSFAGTVTGAATEKLSFDVATGGGGTIAVAGSVAVDGSWKVLDYDNVAQDRSGTATTTFGGTVAIASPGTVTWDRG